MKLDTTILVSKGVGLVGGAVCASLVSNLAQWMNTDLWPSRISWCIILLGAAGAGFTTWVSFVSSSYSDYIRDRNSKNGLDTTPKPDANKTV